MDNCDSCTTTSTCDACATRYEFNGNSMTCEYIYCVNYGVWNVNDNICECPFANTYYSNDVAAPGCACSTTTESFYYTDTLPVTVRNTDDE